MTNNAVAAYSLTGGAWQDGPGRIYDRLAEVVVGHATRSLEGATVLDVGAGTGAATRAALRAGASRVTALDAAAGMLAHDAPNRPPAVVGDLLSLPIADRCFDTSIAAFSLNHVLDPAAGLRELARVTRSGGLVLAAAYAADDTHPVKEAVEAALQRRGWQTPDWMLMIKAEAIPLLATEHACVSEMAKAGLDGSVTPLRVAFSDLTVENVVEWRLGMAHHAPFIATLDGTARAALVAEVLSTLGEAPPVERSILVFQAVTP